MADITAVFNTALKAHNAPPVTSHRYSIDRLDEFLKEAYSIVGSSLLLEAYPTTDMDTECSNSGSHYVPSCYQTFILIHRSCT